MVWLGVFVFSIVFEFFTRTFFTLWFGLGAIVTYALSYLGLPVPVQIIIFLVISLIFLKLFRQYAIKSYKHKTNIHELIGKEAIVCGENANGILVKINGIEWTASNEDGQAMNMGERVIVKDVRGINLLVNTNLVSRGD